jgi:hypothetical protein
MSGKPKELRDGDTAEKHEAPAPSLRTVKVTLHLAVETAQRLGIESAMRRVSQSAIAEEVLAAYLSRWQLPEATTRDRRSTG